MDLLIVALAIRIDSESRQETPRYGPSGSTTHNCIIPHGCSAYQSSHEASRPSPFIAAKPLHALAITRAESRGGFIPGRLSTRTTMARVPAVA